MDSSIERPPASWPDRISRRLLALLAGLYASGTITLLLGYPLNASSAIIGLMAGWLAPELIRPRGDRGTFISTPLIFGACLASSTLLYDGSSDALLYHKPAVLQLLDGWNPYRHSPTDPALNYWSVVYPKASWICGAQLAALTGQLESAKAINLLAMVAAVGTAWTFLRSCSRLSGSLAALGAVVIALNPVTVAQATSFYVDGLLASLFTILLLHLTLLVRGTPAAGGWSSIVIATVLLVNLKFTGLVYAALVLLLAVTFVAACQGARPAMRCALHSLAIMGAALLVFGKTPYLDNLQHHGHPFHPVMGPKKIPAFVDEFRPAPVRDKNRFVRFALMQFTQEDTAGDLRVRRPLELHPFEYYAPDRRVGALGAWFGEVLAAAGILSLVAAWQLRATPSRLIPGIFLGGAVLLTGFCHEDAWWARYSPQLYLLAALPAAVLITRSAWLRRAGLVLSSLMVLSAMIVAFNVLGRSAWISYRLGQDITEMRAAARSQPIEINVDERHPFARTLRERGVAFTARTGVEPRHWRPVYGSTTTFWRPAAPTIR